MKEVLKGSSLNEHRQDKEHGWIPPKTSKKNKEKHPEYIAAFIGTVIGFVLGIITSIYLYTDAKRCNSLLEENRLLKDRLYYKDTNPMDSP